MDTVIDDLVRAFGCPSQKALGELLGAHASTPYTWKPPDGKIPLKRILQIEARAARAGIKLPESFYHHKNDVIAAAAGLRVR